MKDPRHIGGSSDGTRIGRARHAAAGQGVARHCTASQQRMGRARFGSAGPGEASQQWSGTAWLGLAREGSSALGSNGMAWRGRSWSGGALHGKPAMARLASAWLGTARQRKPAEARRGSSARGMARQARQSVGPLSCEWERADQPPLRRSTHPVPRGRLVAQMKGPGDAQTSRGQTGSPTEAPDESRRYDEPPRWVNA